MVEINDDLQKQEAKEQEYLLPDGFGLSLDDVIALLAKKNNISITKDDPILLAVTIHNAFLHEHKKQNEAYVVALEKVYQQVLNTFLENLDKRLQSGNYQVTVEQPNEKKLSESWMLYGVIIFLILALAAVYFWK